MVKTRKLWPKTILIALLGISLSSCKHFAERERTSAFSPQWSRLKDQILSRSITSDTFHNYGPFIWEVYHDYTIPVAPNNQINTDLYLSDHLGPSPLVIISHGNGYSKLAHREQARMLASWGFHCLLLGLPNRGRWLSNGRSIDRLVRLIYAYPHLLHRSVDKDNIILAGHSFGGSAVTIAAALGAPVRGLVLLDPAVVHSTVSRAMRRVNIPVILLGADPSVFASRKRWHFFKYMSGPIAEISIIGATHTDAQYPSIYEVFWGADFVGDEIRQEHFLASIVVSAFSLSLTGRLDYAWQIFDLDRQRGLIKQARVRYAPARGNPTFGHKRRQNKSKNR